MGNCFDKPVQHPNDRLTNWKATGIISLRDAGLKELPTTVSVVGEAAKVLDASNNRIHELPIFIRGLPNLQRLVLVSNCLSSLPAAVCDLPALKILLLDSNELTELPEDVARLSRLEKLSVSHNKLRALPTGLGRLQQLKFLTVSHNPLAALPDALATCEVLEELDASSATLASVPAALGQLKKLKKLNLDGNRITAIPPAVFIDCVSLQTLSLHGNPITPDAIEATEGHATFEERRRTKYNKAIAGGVLLGAKGLDEGVDRATTRS